MRIVTPLFRAVLIAALALGLSAPSVLAQKDNTGTNPANFTYDARFYLEMADLNEPGGSSITNYFELRLPLGRDVANITGSESGSPVYDLGKKFGLRFRTRYTSLSLDTGEEPFGSSDVTGIGDFDARVLWLAYSSERVIVVPGLEFIFDTASNDALGAGKNTLAPVIFAVFPGLLGRGSLFAPGYQYLYSVSGDDDRPDVRRSQIDLYMVWVLGQGKHWLILDPQVVIDHENDKVPALVEAEFGYMVAPSAGASIYIRPGAGIGEDKPYDWNFETGLKFVWR